MAAAARSALRGHPAVCFMRPRTTVIYMTGVLSPAIAAHADRDDIGVIVQPGTASFVRRLAARWAVDNGAFGKPDFDEQRWFAWVSSLPTNPGPLFVVAPDVPGDAVATRRRSGPWLPQIRELGHPAAFAAQNGCTLESTPWDDFDVLFVGGLPDAWGREWKVGANARCLVAEAVRRGKWVHMGRVNTEARLRYAWAIGCDSVDGTFLKYGAPGQNEERLIRYLDRLRQESASPTLWPRFEPLPSTPL